jgi:uncharacterized protein YjiK
MHRPAPTLIALSCLAALIACRQGSEISIPFAPNSTSQLGPEPAGATLESYDFENPTQSFELQPQLHEISALTDINAQTAACVQDELGTVFFIDLESGRIVDRVPFGPPADYEGLTRVDDSLWIIESNGLLTELLLHRSRLKVGSIRRLDLGHDNIEGLGYDAVSGTILIAPKDGPQGTKAEKRDRRVFAFDPRTGEVRADLALDTSLDRIAAEAEQDGIALPMRTTKQGEQRMRLKARFSSIAIHPSSGRIYALSAVDHAVLEFDRSGRFRGIHGFDARTLPQVEGLSFLPNSDLMVASEGANGPARIQVFRYAPAEAR